MTVNAHEEMLCGVEMLCLLWRINYLLAEKKTTARISGLKCWYGSALRAGIGSVVLRFSMSCPRVTSCLHWFLTEAGSFRAKSGTSRASFLPHSVSRIKAQGQPRFKRQGKGSRLLRRKAAGTYRVRRLRWQLLGDDLIQFKRGVTWAYIFVKIHLTILLRYVHLAVCKLKQMHSGLGCDYLELSSPFFSRAYEKK